MASIQVAKSIGFRFCGALLALALAAEACPQIQAQQASDWAQWRGPLGTGEAPNSTPPLEWSETRNIHWKSKLPGRGSGTPIVCNNYIFVLCAVDVGRKVAPELSPEEKANRKDFQRKTPISKQRLGILALNRSDGSIAWKSIATVADPHEAIHEDGTWASSSVATDGTYVVAYFGSYGLFAYDFSGKQLWSKSLSPLRRRAFGEGSSPALYRGRIVIQRDHDGDSELLAFDAKSGRELWRTHREERVTWASPVVVDVDGKAQVLTNGSQAIRAYDFASGKLIWECAGMTPNAIPTPVSKNGVAYFASGFNGSSLLAVRLTGSEGDLSVGDALLWKIRRHTPYVPTPLLMEDRLYFTSSNDGIISAANLQTGKLTTKAQRLEAIDGIYASPVGASKHIYLLGHMGNTVVLSTEDPSKPLFVNHLDDAPFAASPAIAGDELFIRGEHYLYCIGRTD